MIFINNIKSLVKNAFVKPTITCVIIVILSVFTACSDNRTVIQEIPLETTDEVVISSITDVENAALAEDDVPDIYVYVCGAVCSPGVVIVPEGSRAEYALEKAGGFAEGANTVYVNLAAKVTDGQRLYFPFLDETLNQEVEESDAAAGGTTSQGGFPVNVNTADAATLCTLPGIGGTRANAIIEYRTNYGPFERIEDIKNVSGIGDASFEKLAPYICVD